MNWLQQRGKVDIGFGPIDFGVSTDDYQYFQQEKIWSQQKGPTKQPRKYFCNICQITYQTLKGIHLHNLKLHDPEAVWCQLCNRPFKKKENFIKHNAQFHNAATETTTIVTKPTRAPKPLIGQETAPKKQKLPTPTNAPLSETIMESMDPSTLTAYAWEVMASAPMANREKTKNLSGPLMPSVASTLLPSVYPATTVMQAPRREPVCGQDEFCSRSGIGGNDGIGSSRESMMSCNEPQPVAPPSYVSKPIYVDSSALKEFFDGLNDPATPPKQDSPKLVSEPPPELKPVEKTVTAEDAEASKLFSDAYGDHLDHNSFWGDWMQEISNNHEQEWILDPLQ